MTYTREQVYEATLKYFKGDDLAANVWTDKYCLKNDGKYYELTPDEMHWRLAKEFARIEAKYPNPMSEEEIYNLLKDFKYIVPQGSPMAGIGNDFVNTSISNCFYIGDIYPDSYGGIMMADEHQTQLMKRRGGVGQDLSYIRPSESEANGAPLGSNAGVPLYMDRFSNSTREVQQDNRRGALMESILCKHPDTEKFIDAKLKKGKVTGANISVKLTTEFLSAVENKQPFYQVFPVNLNIEDATGTISPDLDMLEYDKLYKGEVVDGVKTYYKKVDANRIWDKIIYNAWKSAEPGLLFWSKTLEESPAKGYGKDWKEGGVNPCSEITLPPFDSCRLLTVNLYAYAYNAFKDNAQLDDKLLIDHVSKAQRLMDDIVDLEVEKIDKIIEHIEQKEEEKEFTKVEIDLWQRIRKKAVDGRRTGLGIVGEGDLLAALGIKYGTKHGTEFSEKLHQLFATTAYTTSIELAKERGAFPVFEHKKEDGKFLNRMINENELFTDEIKNEYLEHGRRNIAVLTIAPTGSVSLMTQTTSGIEPLFSPYYFRKKKVHDEEAFDWTDEVGDKWQEFRVFHRPFIQWYAVIAKVGFDVAEYQLKKMAKDKLDEVFKVSPYFEATAQDVDYIEKVRMQGAVQKWVDHSISVTVNVPEKTDLKTVSDIYMQGWKSGTKGLTIYRENSRGNVLSTDSIKVADVENFDYIRAYKRPKKVKCDVYLKTARKQDFIVFVGMIDGKPYEVFAVPDNDNTHIARSVEKGEITKVKKGVYKFESECGKYVIENLIDHMIETEQNETRSISAMLRHRMNPKFIVGIIREYATITSFHKVIERVLSNYIKEEDIQDKCPECGGKMTFTEGCMKCSECGQGKCG